MKRSFAHWTPRYVTDRLREKLWIRIHPHAPWLTPASVDLLESLLTPRDTVFEWGAGRSTIWFAERTQSVLSIEANPEWHARVQQGIAPYPTATCVLIECDAGSDPAVIDSYCSAPETIGSGRFDVVLIDGQFRDRCALRSVDLIAPGGLLVVDDVQRFLPSTSRAPSAVSDYASNRWKKFAQRVEGWHLDWLGSGVTDTAIWTRPGGPARR